MENGYQLVENIFEYCDINLNLQLCPSKRQAKINKEGGSLSATIIFRITSSKMFEIRLIIEELKV